MLAVATGQGGLLLVSGMECVAPRWWRDHFSPSDVLLRDDAAVFREHATRRPRGHDVHVTAGGGDIADDVAGFLTQWHGPPDRPMREAARRGPRALRQWRQTVSGWSNPVVVQNQMLEPDAFRTEGDISVFYVENQGVWLWGYGRGDDPPVFDRENEPERIWQPTGAVLSRFLFQVTVFETIWAAPHVRAASGLAREQLDRVLAPLTPVDMIAWRWPGPEHRFWVRDGIAAFAAIDDPPDTPVDDNSR